MVGCNGFIWTRRAASVRHVGYPHWNAQEEPAPRAGSQSLSTLLDIINVGKEEWNDLIGHFKDRAVATGS